MRRETAFQRRSPRAAWYWRASFQADSTASEPPEHEEDAVQVAGRERRDLGRQLDRARMGVRPVRVEGQLAHLRSRRLAHLLAERVADLHGEEPGERVEVALAVRVLEVAAVAADDDRDLAVPVAAHAREVQPEMVVRGPLELVGRKAGADERSCGSLRRSAPLAEDVQEHEDDCRREDHRPDHVDLRRHLDARGAPDEEREGLLGAGHEVRDDEVVHGEREREQRRRR